VSTINVRTKAGQSQRLLCIKKDNQPEQLFNFDQLLFHGQLPSTLRSAGLREIDIQLIRGELVSLAAHGLNQDFEAD
jgi:hypothetical protein